MTHKPLLIMGLLLLCAAGLLFFLVVRSNGPNDEKNGFTRRGLHSRKAVYLHELAVGETLYKIIGNTGRRFFFTGKDPRILYSADMQLHRQPAITIPFPLSSQVMLAYDLRVDSPCVHLYANNLSAILSSRLDDTTVHRIPLPTRLFTAIVPLSAHSLVARAFDSAGDRQVLKKIIRGVNSPVRETAIVESTGDAGFSADGMLRYDSSTHRLLYTQFYQNRFFCLDTNLNLLYTARTIDTTNTNPVLTRTFARQNKGSLMPAAPLHIINRACITDGRYIYILSTLKADNEDPADVEKNAVVDVYALGDGAYRRSFYIPNLHHEKAQNLFMANGLLLVSYTKYIGAFQVPPP